MGNSYWPTNRYKGLAKVPVRLYVDMDGVVAKWNTEASIEDTFMPGYFLQREPQSNLIDALKKIADWGEKSGLCEVHFLSAVYDDSDASKEKSDWLKANDLSMQVVFTPYGRKKVDFINTSSAGMNLLLDDFSKNLFEWQECDNCVGIKFLNGINATKGTWCGLQLSGKMSAEDICTTLIGIVMYYAQVNAI